MATSTENAAVSVSLPAFPQFDVEEFSTVAVRWTKYKKRFENLCIALNVSNDKQKLAMMLTYAGERVNDIFESLLGDKDETYENAIQLLDAHFKPQSNISVEIYNFRQLMQLSDEKLHQYYTRLRTQALKCDFKEQLEVELKRQIEHGTNMPLLRRHSFRKPELTLEQLLMYGKDLEDTEFRTEIFDDTKKKTEQEINRIEKFGKNKYKGGKGNNQIANNKGTANKKCFRCGGQFPHIKKCPALGKKCNFCSKMGHFERSCLSKNKNAKTHAIETCSSSSSPFILSDSEVESEGAESESVIWAMSEGNLDDKKSVNATNIKDIFDVEMTVEKKHKVEFLADTGSKANILNWKTFEKLKSQNKNLKLFKTKMKIITYGSTESTLKVVGVTKLLIENKNKFLCEQFYVINTNAKNILSGKTCLELNLISVNINSFEMNSSEIPEHLQPIIQKYKTSLFSGKVGKIKGTQVKLHINESVTPVAERERRIPFALRDEVKRTIEEWEKNDIIEDVTSEPTPWISQMVIVPPQDGKKFRVCVDMRNANEAIERTRYPTPTVEELIGKLSGAKYFSKLDMNSAFHQLELDPNSRYITAFQTEDRIKRFKRLVLGLTSAPEELQHVLRSILAGIPGAMNMADDILVYGKSQEEHDIALKQTLEALAKKGATLNLRKCKFNKRHLEYFGYVFSEEGMRPSKSKVRALNEMSRPENVNAARSFLGFTNYLKRFIPDYSTLTYPIRQLLKKNAHFKWTEECEKSFTTIINILSDNKNLAYFDEEKETMVYCDASPVGISAILLQRTPGKGDLHVINYSSRALTDVESRYSQIERECLGMVYAAEKNHIYLFGRQFTLFNDHKALINILNNKKRQIPLRIERMLLRLQDYDFEAKHVSSDNNISDYASRHPVDQPKFATNYIESYVNMVTKFATPKPFKIEEIATETENEKELRLLKRMIQANDWYKLNEPQKHEHLRFVNIDLLKQFRKVKDELTVDLTLGIILKRNRIVLPTKFHEDAVRICHVGHQGIEKTKQLLRTKIFFFGMDKMVENHVKNCIACQCTGTSKPPAPIKVTKIPDTVWDTLHLDYLGPIPVLNKYVLVIIDKRSRYPEIAFVKSTTAKALTDVLYKVFATYGNPAQIVTDNGPPFPSKEVRDFMEQNGIVHHRITPIWPQANGQVENFNKPLMKAIRAAYVEGKDLETETYKFLRQYRATPHCVTKEAPADMMFGRTIQHAIPHISPAQTNKDSDLTKRDYRAKEKAAEYANHRRHATDRIINIGDQVLVKQQKKNKLSTKFDVVPFIVTDLKGSMITVKALNSDRTLTRNISHFKPLPKTAELPKFRGGREDMLEEDDCETNNPSTQYTRQRRSETRKVYPKRNRRLVSEWRKY